MWFTGLVKSSGSRIWEEAVGGLVDSLNVGFVGRRGGWANSGLGLCIGLVCFLGAIAAVEGGDGLVRLVVEVKGLVLVFGTAARWA